MESHEFPVSQFTVWCFSILGGQDFLCVFLGLADFVGFPICCKNWVPFVHCDDLVWGVYIQFDALDDKVLDMQILNSKWG